MNDTNCRGIYRPTIDLFLFVHLFIILRAIDSDRHCLTRRPTRQVATRSCFTLCTRLCVPAFLVAAALSEGECKYHTENILLVGYYTCCELPYEGIEGEFCF